MMPLSFARIGETAVVKHIGGSPQVKKHLEDLGFAVGSPVTVVACLTGNVIVKVLETRIAVSRELAGKIMV